MGSWRIWHSARSFGDFIVENTKLKEIKDQLEFKSLSESDASKSGAFHKVPDHIKKILYLDAADLIVEYNSEPIICIEETKEAGTGHNAFQRFARIAAAVENNVPAIYVMPEACIITRDVKKKGKVVGTNARWDAVNPMIFQAYNSVMDIFKIPALFFFYPSDYREYKTNPLDSPHQTSKGLIFNDNIFDFPACPTEKDLEMQSLFDVINTIIDNAISGASVATLVDKKIIRDRKYWMQEQYYTKLADRKPEDLSPISATKTIPTDKLLSYLSNFTDVEVDEISELLSSRKKTVIYQCDAGFRGDPYAGALSAIDYLMCRQGKTYEERDANLVLCFGSVDESDDTIDVVSDKCSVDDFIHTVHNCCKKNLLTTEQFSELRPEDIGRYYMQVRYGSTYSKVKHIRVFSYFADAIIFADGALWREA